MKKKVLILLLVLCLSLSIVLAMTACFGIDIDLDDDSDKGNTADDENNGASADVDAFDYNAANANAELETMRSTNGYLIQYEITDNTEVELVSIGAKGKIYYVATGESEYYYDLSDDAFAAFYTKDGDEWSKSVIYYSEYYTQELATSTMESFVGVYSNWFTYYEDFASSMDGVKKTSATVAGRACDKFTFSAAALTGVGLNMARASYSCYVDKETSVCLKWEVSATVDGQSNSWSLECKKFDTNPTFTLPQVSEENTDVTRLPEDEE